MDTAIATPTREPRTGHLVGAAVIGILGLLVAAAGIAGLWAWSTGDHGYITSGSHRYAVSGRAIVSGTIDADGIPDGLVGKLRLEATTAAGRPLFVGVARRADVDRYLAGVARSTLEDVNFGPFRPTYSSTPGSATPAPPAAQSFWAAATTGRGTQTVTWKLRGGDWRVVVMNADGSPRVAAAATVGASIRGGLAIAISLAGAGAALVLLAVAMVVAPRRRRR